MMMTTANYLFGTLFLLIFHGTYFVSAQPTVLSDWAFSKAFDVSGATDPQTFSCLRNRDYMTAFIQIYTSSNDGQIDPNGLSNLRNAKSARLGLEVFVTVQPLSKGKSAYVQFDEMYEYYVKKHRPGIVLNGIWLRVTSPTDHWSLSAAKNAQFIYDYLYRAKRNGVTIGVFTNWYDWLQITKNWSGLSDLGNVKLWYWHANGRGTWGATSDDFRDFVPFSVFYEAPTVKQNGRDIYLCGRYININVYLTSKKDEQTNNKTVKSEEISVGKLLSID